MKLALATLLVAAAGGVIAASVPASAESSYWEQRWRSRDATPEYRQFQDRERRVVKRRVSRGDERRWRRAPARDDAYAEAFPNPFRVERNDGRAHPTMNNDYWLQSSIYDFHAGKAADIKRYRY